MMFSVSLDFFTIDLVSLYLNAAIAVAAFLALLQIAVAKETAKLNSKRDSVKLATEQVRLYLKDFVEVSRGSYNYRNEKKLKLVNCNTRLKEFTLEEAVGKVSKDILKEAYRNWDDIRKNHQELDSLYLDEMNMLEVLATPFAVGVADSDSAFNPISSSFCNSVESLWFEYVIYRSAGAKLNDLFPNTIWLYNLWKSKIERRELETTKEEIERKLNNL